MSQQPDFGKLLPVRNLVSRQTRQHFIDLLTKIDAYEILVNDIDDFAEVIRTLREEGFEDLIDRAGSAFARDLISHAKRHSHTELTRNSKMLNTWFERVASANRTLALHGLMLAESASVSYVPIPDALMTDSSWISDERHPTTSWATLCKYVAGTLTHAPRPEYDRFKSRNDSAYRYLQRFKGTHLLPGPNAEEYIRANDNLIYDKPSDEVFESLSAVIRVSIVTPENGVLSDFVTLALGTPSGYFYRANYSLTTRTLSLLSPLHSLRPLFRAYKIEHVYDFLLETTEELIQAAVLDEGLVFGNTEATPIVDLDATEEANDGEVPQTVETETTEETRPSETITAAPQSPYLRSVTHREVITAFSRLGAVVIQSHHPMISYNGVTVRISNRHQGDPHIVRKSARQACRALGIPWANFIAALR